MKQNTIIAPIFSWRFLLPKYWLTWFSLCLLYIISWFPYRSQLWLGSLIGLVLHKILKRRRHIAYQNLTLSFPKMTADEKNALVRQNFKHSGIAILESGMSWWWPKWRAIPKCRIKGKEHIDAALSQGKGIFLLFYHVLPLEMMGRVLGECNYPCVGFYRPHNNKLIEWVQYRGRCRSNKYMIGKRDVKGLIRALSKGEITVYLPDHDYGRNRSVFVPFFAVKDAATTMATETFAAHKNAVTIGTKMQRLSGNQGYELEFLPPFKGYPSTDSEANATKINQWVEQVVSENIEQYMWVHRRFKTRPDPSSPSLYSVNNNRHK